MRLPTMKPDVLQQYQEKLTTPEEAVQLVQSGDRIYYGVNISIPYSIDNLLAKREPELENVTVGGASCFLPNDLLNPNRKAFHPNTFFFGTSERAAQKVKYVEHTSAHLSETDNWVYNILKPNVAFLPVSAPDENGAMSMGPAGLVCGPYLLNCCKTIILVVNKNIPYMRSDYMAHISDATCIVEMDEPLVSIPNLEPSPALEAISTFIADQTCDGACIQMGIGDLSTAVGFGLRNKNDLGIHSEMMGDSMMELVKRGNVTNTRKTYLPGVSSAAFLMGTKDLYEWADWNDQLYFLPSPICNNPLNIAKNDNVLSVNTALEIDLVGQVVADNIVGTQYSSIGGQLDFVQGAQLSKGGKSFIALTSTHTKNGQLYSNIVPRFQTGTFVTTPRSCVQYVVTEYGCVNLKLLTMRERVLALISLAHPSFREQLRDQAKEFGLLP